MNGGQKLKFLCFLLGDRVFALEIMGIREILRLQPVTPIPDAPSTVIGIINVRGELLPVMDMRKLFAVSGEEAVKREMRIVVGGRAGSRFGMMVDSVLEVVTLSVDEIEPAPTDEADGPVLGIFKRPGDEDGKIVILLKTGAVGRFARGERKGAKGAESGPEGQDKPPEF